MSNGDSFISLEGRFFLIHRGHRETSACTKVFGKVLTALLTGIVIHSRDGKWSFSCKNSSRRETVSVVRLFPLSPRTEKNFESLWMSKWGRGEVWGGGGWWGVLIILTCSRKLITAHPVNILCRRKPEYPEKTHDFRQRVDGLFLGKCHGSAARVERTISEVKCACSDYCATEVVVIGSQGRILVEIVGEVEKNLGEVQRSSSRPP